MPTLKSAGRRWSFAVKLAAAIALAALADALFFLEEFGWTLGLFALAWAVALAVAVPAVRRNRAALFALLSAGLFGLVMVEDPNPLAWLLFWVALSSAALLPRRRFDDAARWGLRLAFQAFSSLVAPVQDIVRLGRARDRLRGRSGLKQLLATLLLPLAGSAVFLWLFALANPLIGNALGSLRLPAPSFENVLRLFFWALVLAAVWPTLRPRALVTRLGLESGKGPELPSASIASLRLSLIAFNLIFAVQNALDLAFLWSGAPLPEGVTLAGYAHRGAYTLIATALLAGLFVLLALAPSAVSARDPLIRRLVIVWTAQNLLLVASSMLRLRDYVDAYSLTVLRIAAFAWMALVACGLLLIVWRMLRGRSAAWLINANAAAAALVLTLASVTELGAIAAWWNVRHAREVDGTGAALDLCYLRQLGSPALLPLIELEQWVRQPELRDRVTAVRADLQGDLSRQFADWRQWSWRDARRLRAVEARLGARPPQPRAAGPGRRCDGSLVPPPEVAPPLVRTAPPPLTRGGER